jgi:hypothetical protein
MRYFALAYSHCCTSLPGYGQCGTSPAGYNQCGTSNSWLQSAWYCIPGHNQCCTLHPWLQLMLYLTLLITINVVTHPISAVNVSFLTNSLIVCKCVYFIFIYKEQLQSVCCFIYFILDLILYTTKCYFGKGLTKIILNLKNPTAFTLGFCFTYDVTKIVQKMSESSCLWHDADIN